MPPSPRTESPTRAQRYALARERLQGRRLRRRKAVSAGYYLARALGGALLALSILAALGALGGLIMLERVYADRILFQVSVRGMSLSELSRDKAREALEAHYAAWQASPITLVFEDQVWTPTAEELGVRVQVAEAVTRAYAVGRTAGLRDSLRDLYNVWQQGRELPLHVSLDEARLQSYLTGLASSIEVPPRNAHLTVIAGRVITDSAQSGRQLLVDATAEDIRAAVATMTPTRLPVRTRLLEPSMADADIATAERQLVSLLASPFTLTDGDREWIWSIEELGSLVQLHVAPQTSGNGQQIIASLDATALEQKLVTLAAEIDSAAVEPRLRFTGVELEVLREGREGARLELAAAREQLLSTLWEAKRTYTLPVTILEPQARPETLASLGIIELVAQGKSSFEGSAPYRVTNIQAGARQMDGVLLAPGDTFSFNQTVGAIDDTNGFVKGYAIIDGRTQLEWGGGVCQVSTTVFRAAFWAGVPITERNQHSFRISWYEKFEPIGMDAAIFNAPGGYDLRFVNDTGAWLLVEAVADVTNEVLTVNLYGTRPEREVIQVPPTISNEVPAPPQPKYIDDPSLPAGTVQQTDMARGGMDVRVGRRVLQNGVVVGEDVFFSRFQPWPNIFVRGSGR
jgi:vancomycin resistance protein YoaR